MAPKEDDKDEMKLQKSITEKVEKVQNREDLRKIEQAADQALNKERGSQGGKGDAKKK